mmetsp:Transcript_7359/g.27057  ORF Transcript_7359/g.27057 Transcript_7359/m.27057 type:complete len:389 (-) Transcript_7359:247-1413(-)
MPRYHRKAQKEQPAPPKKAAAKKAVEDPAPADDGHLPTRKRGRGADRAKAAEPPPPKRGRAAAEPEAEAEKTAEEAKAGDTPAAERRLVKRNRWTDEEIDALKAGIEKHGEKHWKKIMEDPDFRDVLHLRNPAALADKFNSLVKSEHKKKLKALVPKQRKKGRWTETEVAALKVGLSKYGEDWKRYFGDSELYVILKERSAQELKDKSRNLILSAMRGLKREEVLPYITHEKNENDPDRPIVMVTSGIIEGVDLTNLMDSKREFRLTQPANLQDQGNGLAFKKSYDSQKSKSSGRWSEEETELLKAGVVKYGPGKWSKILEDVEFKEGLSKRSPVDLKDKWRVLEKKRSHERRMSPLVVEPYSLFRLQQASQASKSSVLDPRLDGGNS